MIRTASPRRATARLAFIAGVAAITAILLASFGPPLAPAAVDARAGPPAVATAGLAIPTATSSGHAPMAPIHPDAPGVQGSAYSGHYYAGTVYSGLNATATNLAVDMEVPQDIPQATDFYYVILSAWDNVDSYDQVGFTNSNGTWGVTYSTTSACAASYNYEVDAYNLQSDTDYLFDMQIVGSDIVFSVSLPAGGTIWTSSVSNGASLFELTNTFYCKGMQFVGYTDYEEVYDTSAPVPPYAFFFTNNTEDSVGESQWIAYETGSAPSAVRVVTGGTETIVENVPFGLSAAPTLVAEVGPFPRNYSENLSVAKYGTDGRLTPSVSGLIPGARISISPSNGTAPVVFALSVAVNASSKPAPAYTLEIEVTDAQGVYARIDVIVQLNANLAATVPTARPPSTDVNHSVSLTEAPMGGSGSYGFIWSGLPSGCPNDTSTVTCTPRLAGSFNVTVEVFDSLGFFSNSSALELSVDPALTLSAVSNLTGVDVGQAVQFDAVPAGGDGGISYSWSSASLASCTASGSALLCTARTPGTLSVTVTATDTAGSRVSTPVSTVIYSDPSATLAASRTVVDAGRTVTLTVTGSGGELEAPGSGGLSAYAVVWTGLPAGCPAGNSLVVACTWSSAGTDPVSARVLDANGFLSAPASVTLTVAPALVVALSESTSSPLEGESFEISALVSGGSGALHYAWSGLPNGCTATTAANLSCQVSGTGTFDVSVTVTDGAGGNATASGALTVHASFLGLPATEGYAVLGGIIAALALGTAGTALLARRRRRRAAETGPTDDPGGPSE